MTDMTYLHDTLASLGSKRHPFKLAAVYQRDQAVEMGEHGLAAVWNALAATVAGIEDEERQIFARLADGALPSD